MRLFRLLILRHLARARARTLTTVAGIALGIAVVLAIQLASTGAVRGFERAVESLAGRATLEITQAPYGVDERELPRLRWLQDQGQVTPIVQGEAIWTANAPALAPPAATGSTGAAPSAGSEETSRSDGSERPGSAGPASAGGASELLTVIGVDILTDLAFRDYAFAQVDRGQPANSRDFLTLLTDPHAAVFTEKFARAHGLRVGDTVRVDMAGASQTLRIRGLLRDEGPAQAMDGNIILMDIAAAQTALGRLGFVDRLELRLADPSRLDESEARIAQALGDRFLVQRPDRRGQQVEKMVAAFHANLTALSSIALIVGMFLVYNTVSTSVLDRRQEIGMLRAVGTTRATVFALFLGEALVLAVPGCAIGLLLGRLLANGAVALTASTVTRMYVATAAAPPALDAWRIALAFLIGVPLALLSAAAPAWEAARVPPTDAIRPRAEATSGRHFARLIVAAASFVGAAWLCTLDPIDGLPLAGYLATLLVVIGATALTMPVFLVAAQVAAALFRRVFVLECWLATANLVAYARRLSVSVAALAVSLAMTVAIAIMVSSFRETVIYWVSQTLVADLYVGPATARRSGGPLPTVPAAIEAIVRAQPAVAAVDGFRMLSVPYQGSPIFVGSGDLALALDRGRLLFKSPADATAAVRARLGQDAAVVSEAFALRHHARVGDMVTLPTGRGPHPFLVAAIYYDYSNDRGTVMLDRRLFTRYYDDAQPSGLTVYLKPEADVERARAALAQAIGADRGIVVRTNRSLRAEVLRIFDSTFAITWALEIVAVAVAVMGIVATLITVIVERRRELAMLRLVGASRGHVLRMVVAEAAMIGAISQMLGLAVGLVLSLVLVYVINVQSFGWSIQFHVPTLFLLQLTLVLVFATGLAGIYPARRAAQAFLTEQTADE